MRQGFFCHLNDEINNLWNCLILIKWSHFITRFPGLHQQTKSLSRAVWKNALKTGNLIPPPPPGSWKASNLVLGFSPTPNKPWHCSIPAEEARLWWLRLERVQLLNWTMYQNLFVFPEFSQSLWLRVCFLSFSFKMGGKASYAAANSLLWLWLTNQISNRRASVHLDLPLHLHLHARHRPSQSQRHTGFLLQPPLHPPKPTTVIHRVRVLLRRVSVR